MNWIKQNTFLAGLLGVLIVGVLGLGFFLVQARGQHTEAQGRLSSAYSEKARLEGLRPYPSNENADALRKVVNDYRSDANALRNSMLNMQAPMPSGVRVAQFQEDLALKVDAVATAAEASGVVLPEGFYLGMDKYRAQVPLDDAVDRLQFQLDATVRLTDLLFANDVAQFAVRRQTMPFETRNAGSASAGNRGNARGRGDARGRGRGGSQGSGAAASEEPSVSETFPMEVVMEITPDGFQKVLNALSNTAVSLTEGEDVALGGEEAGEYYFVTRWMRVENVIQEGPDRADPDEGEEEEEFVDEDEPFAAAAQEEQLNMAFGAENVRAYLALDLVRFLKTEAAE